MSKGSARTGENQIIENRRIHIKRLKIIPFFLILVSFSSVTRAVDHAADPAGLPRGQAGKPEERDREFKKFLDEGLNRFVNEKDYVKAVESFENALKIKPRDPTARKAFRLAKDKADEIRAGSLPNESVSSSAVKSPDKPAGRLKFEPSGDAMLFSREKSIASPDHAPPGADEKTRLVSEHYNKGLLYFMDERYSKVIKEMEAVLKIDPKNAKARKLLMRAYSLWE